MNAERMMREAERTGRVWLGGEMDLPANEGPAIALARAAKIAENCGYIAGYKYGHSAISVSGGDIPGEIVLDWFHPGNSELKCITIWRPESAYRKEPTMDAWLAAVGQKPKDK